MKRPLVANSEHGRHPFRQSLPRHVTAIEDDSARLPKSSDQDWKLFVLSFAAFFTVAYSFIF